VLAVPADFLGKVEPFSCLIFEIAFFGIVVGVLPKLKFISLVEMTVGLKTGTAIRGDFLLLDVKLRFIVLVDMTVGLNGAGVFCWATDGDWNNDDFA